MKTRFSFLYAGALAMCASSFAATSASESIEASLRNLFKALDAGDRAAVLAYGPGPDTKFPVVMFDYDLENKPVAIEGVEAANRWLTSLVDEMAKRKVKVASTVSNLRTGSRSPELGFAVFDLVQTITADGKSETSKFWITMLWSFDKKTNKWRLFHGHATLVPAEARTGK